MSVPHCILMTDLSQDSEENPEETPKKRARVTYSTEQISKLEQLYGRNRYPNREIRSKLASTLNINERQLHTWFHHHEVHHCQSQAYHYQMRISIELNEKVR